MYLLYRKDWISALVTWFHSRISEGTGVLGSVPWDVPRIVPKRPVLSSFLTSKVNSNSHVFPANGYCSIKIQKPMHLWVVMVPGGPFYYIPCTWADPIAWANVNQHWISHIALDWHCCSYYLSQLSGGRVLLSPSPEVPAYFHVVKITSACVVTENNKYIYVK